VDGLTPAHHFPFKERLIEMRGEGIETRDSFRKKIFVSQTGDTARQLLIKNWKFWGAKGIWTNHFMFEFGIASTIFPLRLKEGYPNGNDAVRVRDEGLIPLFKEAAQKIYELRMYERFQRHGWTKALARQTRLELAPLIVRLATLAWYEAAFRAYGSKK
jgi:hypothetical protein